MISPGIYQASKQESILPLNGSKSAASTSVSQVLSSSRFSEPLRTLVRIRMLPAPYKMVLLHEIAVEELRFDILLESLFSRSCIQRGKDKQGSYNFKES